MKMNYKVSCFVLLLSLLAVHGENSQESNQEAAQYLTRYGYLSMTRAGNHNAITAIKQFQKFFHLQQTGELDSETRIEMQKPRCGNPDVDESGDRVRRYVTGPSQWGKSSLTYRFLNTGTDLSADVVKSIIERAFGYWSAVTPLAFTEATGSSDFKFGFFSGSHGDNSPFDGSGPDLAHAYDPPDGNIHFDDDETFSNGQGGTDLLWVAVHEIGHAIGLDHSDVIGAIMWPTYEGYIANLELHEDDINGIRSLYGSESEGGTCFDIYKLCPTYIQLCTTETSVMDSCKKTCGGC